MGHSSLLKTPLEVSYI